MWSHKKYGKRLFKGRYEKAGGERVLVLSCVGLTEKVFDHPTVAKRLGWIYQKKPS